MVIAKNLAYYKNQDLKKERVTIASQKIIYRRATA